MSPPRDGAISGGRIQETLQPADARGTAVLAWILYRDTVFKYFVHFLEDELGQSD